MRILAHISDLHFGTERPELADGLRADLETAPPSLLVISGDLTQRARGGQFAAAQAYLATLPTPQLVIPGNHDVPLFDVTRRFFAPLSRYRKFISGELNPVYEDNEIFVAGINTARSFTWKAGRISLEQIAATEERLRATRARFKVVVTHHPFIPPPIVEARFEHIDLVGRAVRAMTMLDAEKVDLLLAGHLHRGYSGDTRTQYPAAHRGIISAQAGTAISHRVRGAEPNGYNRITLDGDRVTVEVRIWRNGAFAADRRTEYDRTEKGWTVRRTEPTGCDPALRASSRGKDVT